KKRSALILAKVTRRRAPHWTDSASSLPGSTATARTCIWTTSPTRPSNSLRASCETPNKGNHDLTSGVSVACIAKAYLLFDIIALLSIVSCQRFSATSKRLWRAHHAAFSSVHGVCALLGNRFCGVWYTERHADGAIHVGKLQHQHRRLLDRVS